ncbi:MAG: hypothetical protein CL693_00080 [Cellvibrionaceae bacterium]|nr:hypothetical protein [Cellvibrionaceae bacterium]
MLTGSVQSMADEELTTLTDRVSYIFGYNLGSRFGQDQVDLNIDVFAEAMKAAKNGKAPAMTEAEMQQVMTQFQELQQAKMAQAQKAMAEANLQAGETFLAENAKKDGVKTTSSGLQYKVLTQGSGAKPTQSDKVSVHYSGTLIDGTEFDSSYRRGEPAAFGVTQVIPGWTEALMMMPEGSKWEIYVPSQLAYGAGGSGPKIGPNSTLIFEIELLKASVQ